MSLQVLLALVVGGIAGIAALLHILGLTDPRQFARKRDAELAWLREVPEHPPTGVQLSSDRLAALITTDNVAGLVWCFGDDTVARVLQDPAPQTTDKGLRFGFSDFGSTTVNVNLTKTDRDVWLNTMRAL